MWFPSKSQWVVIWIGFILAFACIGIIIGSIYGDLGDLLSVVTTAAFFIVGTSLVVWMIEGRRRRRKSENVKE